MSSKDDFFSDSENDESHLDPNFEEPNLFEGKNMFRDQMPSRNDQFPYEGQIPCRNEQFPHEGQMPCRNDQFPYEGQIPCRNEQFPHEGQMPCRNDQFPYEGQIPCRNDQFPHEGQMPCRNDQFPHEGQMSCRNDQFPYEGQMPFRNEQMHHEGQMPFRHEQMHHEGQMPFRHEQMHHEGQIGFNGLSHDSTNKFETRDNTRSNLFNESCDSVVSISGRYKNFSWGGSGFFVYGPDMETGYCVTNAHVVLGDEHRYSKARYIWVNISNFNNTGKNQFVKITDYYVDVLGNIAVFKVPKINLNHKHLNFADFDLVNNGDDAYILGNPLGIDCASISKGIIRNKQYTFFDGGIRFDSLLIDSAGYGGNSGSPILDYKGDIIGIYGWGIEKYECLGGGTKGDLLEGVVNIIIQRIQYESPTDYIEKRYLGLSWKLIDLNILEHIKGNDFPSDGVIITDIKKDSPFFSYFKRNDLFEYFIIDDKKFKFGYQSYNISPETAVHLIQQEKIISVGYSREDEDEKWVFEEVDVILDEDFSDKVNEDTFGGGSRLFRDRNNKLVVSHS
jgi:S1-C subfamily serine protease